MIAHPPLKGTNLDRNSIDGHFTRKNKRSPLRLDKVIRVLLDFEKATPDFFNTIRINAAEREELKADLHALRVWDRLTHLDKIKNINTYVALYDSIMQRLISPACQDTTGWSILFYAAGRGNMAMVKDLIKAGINVNVSGKNDRRTALQFAIEGGHIDMVKILIDSGADINHIDSHGDDPLYTAARCGQTDIAETLIHRGAHIKQTHSHDVSTVQAGVASGNPSLVSLLLYHTLRSSEAREVNEIIAQLGPEPKSCFSELTSVH